MAARHSVAVPEAVRICLATLLNLSPSPDCFLFIHRESIDNALYWVYILSTMITAPAFGKGSFFI